MITETEIENADDFAALLDKIEELQEENARLEQENRNHCDKIAALMSQQDDKNKLIEKLAGELTKALEAVVELRK